MAAADAHGFPGATTQNNRFADNIIRDNNGSRRHASRSEPRCTEVTDGNVIRGGSIFEQRPRGHRAGIWRQPQRAPPAITQVTITGGSAPTLVVAGTAARSALVQLYDDAETRVSSSSAARTASDGDGTWSLSSFLITDLNGLITTLQSVRVSSTPRKRGSSRMSRATRQRSPLPL